MLRQIVLDALHLCQRHAPLPTEMEKQLNSYSQRGLRTLAVASREFSPSDAESFITRLSDVSAASFSVAALAFKAEKS